MFLVKSEEFIFMKKIAIALIAALMSNNSSAFQDFQSTPRTLAPEQEVRFLETHADINRYVPIDEYTDQDEYMDQDKYVEYDDRLKDLDEYDQNITDNVASPKIGTAEAFLREVLGSLLIRYISMRETARLYCKEVKDILIQWYHRIIKA